MFNQLSLGMKLGVGFGVVVLIAIGLGAVAVTNMKSVEGTTRILVNENVPEVTIANETERAALQTMYTIRAYVFTHTPKFLEEGRKNLEDMKKYLRDAKAHAGKSARLAKLKEASERGEQAALEYERLLDETEKSVTAMETTLKGVVPLGDKFLGNMGGLLKEQNEAIDRGSVTGTDAGILKVEFKKLVLIQGAIGDFKEFRKLVWQGIAKRDPDFVLNAIKMIPAIEGNLGTLGKLEDTEEKKADVQGAIDALGQYGKEIQTFVDYFNKVEGLNAVRGAAATNVLKVCKDVALMGMDDTTKASVSAAQALASSTIVMIIGLAIGAVLAAVIALVITRGITGPVNRIIGSLNDGADQTAAAATQVSAAAQQLSQGATEQAASIEETSSSLDEINSMTRQNADSASKANQLAAEASGAAEKGNTAMGDMQHAMSAINESSDKISKIIKTIEEIAFQTNLLALNAAVEAARAGEHGKGFAVVADEVRNLAQRAATAAKDTAALIEDNVIKAKGGADIARKAGEALRNIMENSKKVADIIAEIAAASKEQADGVGQITGAVSQLDQVTQQNASAAEESAAASEELNSQAESLKEVVVDLQRIVRGAHAGMMVSAAPALPGGEKRKALAHQAKVTHLGSQAAKKKVPPATKTGQKPRPEEVIPLDDVLA